jgi:hypothetical protein
MRAAWAALGVAFLVACESKPGPPERRAVLKVTGPATFELLPTRGQDGFCLAYTLSKTGTLRLLTMSEANQSFECPAEEPIGGAPFRVPPEEGPVRVFVLFTSQSVSAASVSEQLLEVSRRPTVSALDLRLPGRASLEVLDFAPASEGDAGP